MSHEAARGKNLVGQKHVAMGFIDLDKSDYLCHIEKDCDYGYYMCTSQYFAVNLDH